MKKKKAPASAAAVDNKTCNLNIRVPTEILKALGRAVDADPDDESNISRYVRQSLRESLKRDGFLDSQ